MAVRGICQILSCGRVSRIKVIHSAKIAGLDKQTTVPPPPREVYPRSSLRRIHTQTEDDP